MYVVVMNIDLILQTLSRHNVDFLLFGGVNFMLRHEPVLTFDVDIWVRPEVGNLERCEVALREMEAEWGETEVSWGLVSEKSPGWLGRQAVYCMICKYGALDIFLAVKGLDEWEASAAHAVSVATGGGASCRGLSDEDMLRCQQALPENEQKKDRVRVLSSALKERGNE